jgi:hypothetical protein
VPGGGFNAASGDYSFAAGHWAAANHEGAFVWADTSADTEFASASTNVFLIRATNGVGIGTNDTLANGLTVNGQVIAGGVASGETSTEPLVSRGSSSGVSMDDRTGGASQRWAIYPSGGVLYFWNNTGNKLSIGTTGLVAIATLGSGGGGNYLCRNASNQISTCSSSVRYKTNIAPLEMGLEVIKQLRPVTFDWKESGEADLGLVAEEVNEVSPLLTTYNADGQIEGVKYSQLSAVLVNAVQELEAQNADLEARLAALEQGRPASPAGGFGVNVWMLAFLVISALLLLAVGALLGIVLAPRLVRRNTP